MTSPTRARARSHPDDYQSGRRWPLVALGLLGVLVLGVVIGRASAPDPELSPAPAAPAQPDVTWPGPTDVDDGVPVGYAHSEAGAVAAAAQYSQALAGRGTLDDERRSEVLDLIATNASRQRLEDGMAPGAEEVREGFGLSDDVLRGPGFLSREAVAGYRMDAYSEARATVSLWGTGVMVVPGVQGLDAGWSTTTVELVWERDDWRLDSIEATDGPSPTEAGPETSHEVGRRMNEFQELWHVPAD